ncbi:MAG: MlaD family protein [Candidatus Omnitrophica bacterium]|nr:MlaD family protein [Candidatus Omnitrophota bacterium]
MDAKPISFEIKVGIFIFIGILLTFIIVFSIGEFYILKPMYHVKVLFGFANGIAMGAPVRLAGVQIGEIENIKIFYDEAAKRTKVMLVAELKQEAKVEKNAVCKINTLGLLGEKYLEISPGTADVGFLANQDEIAGVDPIPMEEITKTMKDLAESAKSVTQNADIILQRLERGEGTVGKLLKEEEVYDDLRDLVKDVKAHPWKLFMKGKEQTGTRDVEEVSGKEKTKGFAR